MTFENIIIIAVIILLFTYGMAILQFLILLYYRFRYPDFKPVEKDEVDMAVWEVLKPYEVFLKDNGFKYIAMLEHTSPLIGNTQRYHIVYYYNDANGVHAFVKTQPHRGALEPVTIEYRTLYDDGKQIVTVNGVKHFVQYPPKYQSMHDHYLTTPEAIYQAHLQEIEKEQGIVNYMPFNKETLVSFEMEDTKAHVKSLEDVGVVKADENGYRFRPSLATWRFAKRAAKEQMAYAKKLKQHGTDRISTGEGEVYALSSQLEAMGKPRGKSNKRLWFALSVAAFALLFALLGFSLVDIVILIVVLLVHELGHYLAMRYYGYKDTSILFLPFGAAAFGNKEHRKAFEEYIVFLAGPLPGIVIGVAILAWSLWQHHTLSTENPFENPLVMYAIMSLVINYINLLPIYPLDGGRILQLLLLHRYPKGQFYFYMVSLLALVVAMVWLQDPVLLIFVGIVALGAKQSYRVSRFMSRLFVKYTPESLDKAFVIQEIVNDESLRSDTLHAKANVAKQAVHIIQTSRPSRWLLVFGLAWYLLLLVPPFFVPLIPHILSSVGYDRQPQTEYDRLPKEVQSELDSFYAKVHSLEKLTHKPIERYALDDSMAIIEKYLYDKDTNRTVGQPLVVAHDTNLSNVPEALLHIYRWHNGITQLLPEGDLLSLTQMQRSNKDYIAYMQEDGDANFTTPYRIFIREYGYTGLAYHLHKEGIYHHRMYDSETDPDKRYYDFNHLLKVTAEAYKRGVYYHDYDGLTVDDAQFAKLKRAYLSTEDKARYQKLVQYLQEQAVKSVKSPYAYVKKEILWRLARTHDPVMIPYIKHYLHDASKKVRQQAVHSLGVLGDRRVIPLLVKHLDDDPMHCKGCALSALMYLVNKEDTALLEKIYPTLSERKMWIRRNAYSVIGKIADRSSLPTLKKHFDKEHPACKLAMVEAFGRIGDKEALPLLEAYLQEVESMDFSVSYDDRSPLKNPHPDTLKAEVKKAISVIRQNIGERLPKH